MCEPPWAVLQTFSNLQAGNLQAGGFEHVRDRMTIARSFKAAPLAADLQ